MTPSIAAPRPVRVAAAAVGALGILALAACSPTEAEQTDTAPADTSTPAGADAGSGQSTYLDGTYTAQGSYQTPETVETVTVTLTLAGDVITDVEVTGDPQARESQQYQSQFIGGIADVVVGKDIDEISVSRVAGSSLTSGGFGKAVEEIKADAAA